MNDKGLVTRDRQTKKDVFYFYKSLWNKFETTVYFTSRRLKYFPAGEDLRLKVYSNAKSLTLYQNGRQVEKMKGSGESTRVVWQFSPLKLKTDQDTFKVVADDGTTDEITISRLR
jgi:beta-galactosidase